MGESHVGVRDESPHTDRAVVLHGSHFRLDLRAQHSPDALASSRGRKRHRGTLVLPQLESDFWLGEREAPDELSDVTRFRRRRLEKLAARRRGAEEIEHFDPAPGRSADVLDYDRLPRVE